jgi:hypothetical protein
LKQTTNLIKEKPRCKTILLKWKKYKANNTWNNCIMFI